MNNLNYIRFKKQRDLGQILSDTIKFFRQEGLTLVSIILKVSVIPILMVMVAGVYYVYISAKSQSNTYDSYGGFELDQFDIAGVMLALALLFVAYIVAYGLVSTTTLGYIDSYEENRGEVNFSEVSKIIKTRFASYIGLSILSAIVMGVGLMLCIIPFFYFWPILALAPCIMIFQRKGAFDAFGDSFGYFKNHFWNIFGCILVIFILIFFISFIVNLPMTFYTNGSLNIFSTEATIDIDKMVTDPIYLILTIISYSIAFFFHIITMIAYSFIFFDIEEQEHPSTSDVIDEIGVE